MYLAFLLTHAYLFPFQVCHWPDADVLCETGGRNPVEETAGLSVRHNKKTGQNLKKNKQQQQKKSCFKKKKKNNQYLKWQYFSSPLSLSLYSV